MVLLELCEACVENSSRRVDHARMLVVGRVWMMGSAWVHAAPTHEVGAGSSTLCVGYIGFLTFSVGVKCWAVQSGLDSPNRRYGTIMPFVCCHEPHRRK